MEVVVERKVGRTGEVWFGEDWESGIVRIEAFEICSKWDVLK